jgi:hypothetical protein
MACDQYIPNGHFDLHYISELSHIICLKCGRNINIVRLWLGNSTLNSVNGLVSLVVDFIARLHLNVVDMRMKEPVVIVI